jgi:hypothetical protein
MRGMRSVPPETFLDADEHSDFDVQGHYYHCARVRDGRCVGACRCSGHSILYLLMNAVVCYRKREPTEHDSGVDQLEPETA